MAAAARAAARAGRRRFEQLDRNLERAAKLRTRLDNLDGRIRLAAYREQKDVSQREPDHEVAPADSDTADTAR